MSKCIKLAVFTFLTTFIFGFIISENVHGMGLYGTDENGRQVNVIDVDKYLKQNPYRPPARKKPAPRPAPKPKPRPVAKKPAPKPAPKKKLTQFSISEAFGASLAGSASTTVNSKIQNGKGLTKAKAKRAGLGGLVGGAVAYSVKWGWDNRECLAEKFVDDREEQARYMAKKVNADIAKGNILGD